MSKFYKSALVIALALCMALIPATAAQRPAEAAGSVLRDLENSFVEIAEKAKPSVAHLTSERRPLMELKKKMDEGDIHPSLPFGIDPERFRAHAAGSGVVISKEGHILTNHHLVEKSEKITVRIIGADADRGKEYEGQVIGVDPATDLAVVKIEPDEPLTPAKLGDSSKLRVGQWAIAIGDPFGFDKTVTVGVISGLGRSRFEGPLRGVRYQNFIQTDASINQGNSGGPLLNIDGEVIGINTFIHAAGQNLGFAIPIEMAKEVYDELIEHGEVVRGFLGVGIKDLDESYPAFKAPDMKGALVERTFPNMPAREAGIRHGDVIREVDGHEVETSRDLQNVIAHKRPGDKVHVTLLRKGKKKEFTVELIKFPDPDEIEKEKPPRTAESLLGLTVERIPEHLARPGEQGVYVTEVKVDSPGDESGLSEGDIILEVDLEEVSNVKEFRKIISKLQPGDWVGFYIRRGNETLYRQLKIPNEEE